MVEMSKILVCLVVWVIIGAGIYWGTAIWYMIKVSMLNCKDFNELMAEFANLISSNIFGIRKTDKPDDVKRKVLSLTGEPIVITHLRIYLVWPDTTAKLQLKLKEAYELLREKYGVRVRNSAT